MQKIIPVIGTRPEAIKLAPVIKELERHPKEFKVIVGWKNSQVEVKKAEKF